MVPGLRRHRRCRRRLRPATRRVDMRTLGTNTQHTCLQASQGPGSPNFRTTLPRWSVPLYIQRPVGRVASLGRAALLAAARPRTLLCEASLVLALPRNQVASLGVLLSGVRIMGILRFAG